MFDETNPAEEGADSETDSTTEMMFESSWGKWTADDGGGERL